MQWTSGLDRRIMEWLDGDSDGYREAVRYCGARRTLYGLAGILFALLVALASWLDTPIAVIPCLMFSFMFFMAALYYDATRKVMLLASRCSVSHRQGAVGAAPPDGHADA